MKLGCFLFGQREDPHIVAITQELKKRRVDVLVFDQYKDQAAIKFGGASGRTDWPFAEWFDNFDHVVVYSRVKLPMAGVRDEFTNLFPRADELVGPYQTKEFHRAEWRVFTRALLRVMSGWATVSLINKGAVLGDAACKPLQLAVAQAVGFRVPPTVIGNCEAELDAHFDQTLLWKPLSSASAAGRGVPPPAMLNKSDVLAEGRATVCPSIFQRRIEKRMELRVHVSGGVCRTVEIDSQSLPYSRLDWRTAQTKADVHKMVETPRELVGPIRDYMREFDLNIGVFDIAVDLDGGYVFFECNPSGQYMLMERFTGAPISKDIAELIAGQGSGQRDTAQVAGALDSV